MLLRRWSSLVRQAGSAFGPRTVPAAPPPPRATRPPLPVARIVRAIAPPASGKTQAVVDRVVVRVGGGTAPDRLIVLAPDDVAAERLAARIEDALGGRGAPAVETLDRLAHRLLREHVPHEFRPLATQATRERICREVLAALEARSADRAEALPREAPVSAYLALFSLLKSYALDPRDPSPQGIANIVVDHPAAAPVLGADRDPERVQRAIQSVYWLYRAYDLALRNELCLEPLDRKLRLWAALVADPVLAARARVLIDEVIVDDCHRASRLDLLLLRLLSSAGDLFVAGDDDEPVHRAAGDDPELFGRLPDHLDAPTRLLLASDVADCPRDVVLRAERLIAYNRRRFPKELNPRSAASDGLVPLRAGSSFEEARRLIELLTDSSGGTSLVLYRPCATLYHLQLRLLFAGRRYVVPAEDDALGFGALDAALGALRLRSTVHAGMEPTPRDAVLTLRALLPGAAALPDTALAELLDGRPFLVAIDCADLAERLPEAGEGRLGAALAQLLSRRPPSVALDGASDRVGRLGGLRQAAALDALGDIAAELGEDQRRLVWALEDLLARAGASAAPSEPEVELRPHEMLRSGQWDTVALIGCNEGLLPSPRELLDDERRRMYDAMLRARRRLIVSWVQADGWAAPSRFLIEAGIG